MKTLISYYIYLINPYLLFCSLRKGSAQRFLREMRLVSLAGNKELQEKEKQLKQHIYSSGLQMRGEIPKDGNCLFHAVADQMKRLGDQSGISHTSLRSLAVETLRNGLPGVRS